MKQLTKHFHIDEFRCKDKENTPVPREYYIVVRNLAENLEILRSFLNKPINISSGYRTQEYNKAVGGRDNSYHKIAAAADIWVEGMTPIQLKQILEGLIRIEAIEEGGIGLYSNFIHYDIRGTKARWEN